jgi:hypothetical protein
MATAYHEQARRSLIMARPLYVLATALLALSAYLGSWGEAFPFSVSYVPHHHLREWAYAAAAAYLTLTLWLALHQSRAFVIWTELALLVAAAVTFAVYHRGHPTPHVFVWDAYEPATPFHEQLAPPVFIALALAPLMLVSTRRTVHRPLTG